MKKYLKDKKFWFSVFIGFLAWQTSKVLLKASILPDECYGSPELFPFCEDYYDERFIVGITVFVIASYLWYKFVMKK